MTITTDILLPRPKLDYDGGYDVVVKGPSVVVIITETKTMAAVMLPTLPREGTPTACDGTYING